MADKLTIDLAVILPGIPDEQDSCIVRLTKLLEAKGLEKVHIVQEESIARLCLHYDPDQFNVGQLRGMARLAGAEIDKRYHHESLSIKGMDCSACAKVIEHALLRMDGVLEAVVSYHTERLRLEYDSELVTHKAIVERLKILGYSISEQHEHAHGEDNLELIFSLASGVLLLTGWLLGFSSVSDIIPLVLFIAAYIAGGFFTLLDAWRGLRSGNFDIDTLMIVAAAGAAALGAWAEGALLLFLFSLGHALEHRAMERARKAIEALADLAPKTALVKRNGTEIEVPVEELKRGEFVIVKPGQRIPADGVVQSGLSAVDQAPVTGESMPVDKQSGDNVFTGTINGEGVLVIEVTKLAKESTLARMVELVSEAETQRSPTQQFTKKFEKIFVPVVLIGVVLLMVVPPLLGFPFGDAFYRAMAMLVAASPCALAIGTPAAVLSGVARAANAGVLIKGGIHLENLGRINAIAFDKTGTITNGKPQVTDVVNLDSDENELLAIAAAVESRSAHPLAQAVVDITKERGIEWQQAGEITSVTGKGVRAELAGHTISIGNLKLFEPDSIPNEVSEEVNRLEKEGKTTMVVQSGERFLGVLALSDTERKNAASMLKQLHKLGVTKTIMLTGDNARVAKAVGDAVGLDEVKADLMPEDKLSVIKSLLQQYKLVAMIGDGVNDAPAMARATVGIAMGGAGTDVALETADVVLMADDLDKLPFAVGLSRASRRIIQQNLWLSLSIVALLIPATLFGFAGIGPAVVIHEGSTLVVVLNALRLLRYKEV
jgi:Cd2+/Zn2+-exporting ATPase